MCSYWKSVDDGDLEAVVRGFNKSRNTNSNNNVCSDNHANGGSGNEESYDLQKFSCLGFGVETQQQPWFGSTGDVDAVLSAVSGVDCGNYQQAQAPFSLLDLPNNNSNPMFSPTNLFYSCSASSSSSSSAFVLDQGSAASPCSSSAAATAAAAFVADKPKKSEHSGTSAASSSSSSACKAPAQIAKRRKAQQKRTVCVPAATGSNRPSGAEGVPSDLWAWRKYGQKPIKGSPYPRGYYRCSSSKGCSARKQVERSRNDPTMLVITYTSDHNHPWPTHRNALAGSTRQHVSSDKYNTIPLNSFESADVFPEGNQNRLQAEKSQDCNNKKSNFNDDSNQLQSSSPTASASAPDDEITAAASHDDSVFNHHHDDDFFADLGELPDSLFVFAKNPEKERDGKRSEEEAPDEDPLEAFNNWSNSAAFVHLHAKTSQM